MSLPPSGMQALEQFLAWSVLRDWMFRLFEEGRLFGRGIEIPGPPIPQGGEWLEVGCGNGIGSVRLVSRVHPRSVVATDVDPGGLLLARSRLAATGVVHTLEPADARKLPFPDATFDGALCLLVLHHVPGWRQVVPELARVLRPGGVLLVSELTSPSWAATWHRRLLGPAEAISLDDLVNAIEGAGLTVVRSTPLSHGIALDARK